MKTIIGYEASASSQLYLLIKYKCKRCKNDNMTSKVIGFEGIATGNRWTNRETLAREAREKLSADMQTIQYEIKSQNYKNLGLDCRCHECKARPIWTKFFSVKNFWRNFVKGLKNALNAVPFLGFVLVAVLVFLFALFKAYPILIPIVLAICMIPILKNLIVQLITSKLPEEYLPNIEVKTSD